MEFSYIGNPRLPQCTMRTLENRVEPYGRGVRNRFRENLGIAKIGLNDYFLGKCSLIVGEDQFLGRSAHFFGGKLSLFGLSDA